MTEAGASAPAGTGGLRHAPFAASAALVEVVSGRRTLTQNERGAHVRLLEQALVNAGFGLPGGAEPDVVFTKNTAGTLARFQKAVGLPQSGVLDQPTLSALDGFAAEKRRPGAVPPPPGAASKAPSVKVDTIKLMNEILAEARSPSSGGGSRITKAEVERALAALKWDDGVVAPAEMAAAKAALEAETFTRFATADAKAHAEEFLRTHAGAGAGGPSTALQVSKLDPEARAQALGAGVIAKDAQAARVTLPAGGPAPELADVAKRAFGRTGARAASLVVDPFRPLDGQDLLRALQRKVLGKVPSTEEALKAQATFVDHARGGGQVLLADWREGEGRAAAAGSFLVAVKPGARELFVVDLLREEA